MFQPTDFVPIATSGATPQKNSFQPTDFKPISVDSGGKNYNINLGKNPQTFLDMVSNVGNKISNFMKPITDPQVAAYSRATKGQDPLSTGIQAVGQGIIGGVGDIAGKAATPLLKTDVSLAKGAYNLLAPGYVKDLVSKGGEELAKTDITSKLSDLGVKTSQDWQDFSQKHPTIANDISGTIDIASVFPAEKIAAAGVDVAKAGIKSAAETLAKGATEKVATKTPQAIIDKLMLTPEKDLPKLSPDERAKYFNKKQEELDASQKLAEESAAKQKSDILSATEKDKASSAIGLKNKASSLQKEAENLASKADTSAKSTTLSLRPKAKILFSKMSNTFRNIFEKEFEPFKNIEVKQSELEAYVRSRFVPESGEADKFMSDMGLKSGDKTSKSTLGNIYNKTREIKSGMSTGARKGTRVFSESDMAADKNASILSDFMKTKGVDLSQSNKFWSEWAPVRDKINTQIKPFSKVTFDTDTFSATLKRAASGADKDSKSFVDVLEKQLGEPFSKEQKNILGKMDANKRQQIANEIEQNLSAEFKDTEGKKSISSIEEGVKSSKKSTESARESLKNKQFSVNQEAEKLNKRNSIIKKILWGAGIAGASAIGADAGAKALHNIIP